MSQLSSTVSSGADFQPGLRSLVARFETPRVAPSLMQLATSIGLFAVSWTAMYWSLHLSYLLTLLLAVPTAGFVVRTFIVQHDCGHGAFFKSKRANDIVGILCSSITFTPYGNWRRHHNCHHASWNNLDRRDSGADIYSSCRTVAEYEALPKWRRILFRLYRHPIVAQLILPPLVFLFVYRTAFDTPKTWGRERRSVYWTNLLLFAVWGSVGLMLGFAPMIMIELPVIALAAMMGVFLFALQHRFDGVVWERQGTWDATIAAVKGSSYFKLPRLLQWFTGNIGFHHIHHLSPRVPNYRLEACHGAIAALQSATTLTLRDGFQAIRHMLWDETNRRMVRFADLRRGRRTTAKG